MNPRVCPTLALVAAFAACRTPPEHQTLYSQAPARPYSAVVRVGDTFYFAGKIGVTDETRTMTAGRTAAEVVNIMESFRTLFHELGLDFGDVVQANVFLVDINDYEAMNDAYARYFTGDPPARTTVAVAALPGHARVEIAFTAVRTPG